MGRPDSVLFVGNSYFAFNNGVGWHVSHMHASTNPASRLRSTSVLITGSGLDGHDVESYFRPGTIGAYSFDAANNVVFANRDRLFDVVLMMDCSQCPIHPVLRERFQEAVHRHCRTVRRHGAEPMLAMSWAYADRPEMTEALAEAYSAVARINGVSVVPVGLAFAKALSGMPSIGLHMADKSHPTLAGTYLAASCIYAALFDSPAGLAYAADLDRPTAAFLQRVAEQTVREYRGFQ